MFRLQKLSDIGSLARIHTCINTIEPAKPPNPKIKANRENAQKSAGPRSPEGRAASSRNSITHGLTANDHLLSGEDPEEFLVLLKDLYDRFHPVGPGEEKLVQRIAGNQWRLDRAFAMEAGIFRNRLRELAEDFEDQVQDYPRKKASAEFQRNPVPRPPPPARMPTSWPTPSTPIASPPTPSPSSPATKPPSSAP